MRHQSRHTASSFTIANVLRKWLTLRTNPSPRAQAHTLKEPPMATISNARKAQAPTGFGSWDLAKAAFAALAIASVTVLAGCGGGGGGSSTPDGPTVGPLTVTLTLVSAEVKLVGGTNVVVYTALGTKGADSDNVDITATTTVVPTLTGQALKAGATLSVAASGRLQENVSGVATDLVVTPGVTVTVGGNATYGGKTITVTPTVLTETCEVGLAAVGGKCKVPAWITDNMVVVSASPATVAQRMIRFFDGSSSKDYVMPTGTLNCAANAVELGVHGGAIVTCNGVKGYDADGTYEVSPTYAKKLDSVVRFDEVNYKSANPSTWWMKTTPCGGGTGWEIPGSKVCYAQNAKGNDILIVSGVTSGEMQSLQSAIAATSLK